jgi:glycosyltransferase involved in cell wall biosynthesis
VKSEKTIQALYLSYDGMTDPLGQSQVIPYLAGLSGKNIQFTLVSFEKPDAFSRSGATVKNILDKHRIKWVPLRYTKDPPVFSTLLDIWRLKRAVRKILRGNPVDVIHCRSYITALAGLWAKKKWGVQFIFDMRGLWADERVDGKLWNLDNPVYRSVYRYFKKRELEFLIHADHTISLTRAAKEEILSWPELKDRQLPIEVIPCCVDTDAFDPATIEEAVRASWKSRLGIGKNDRVLSYIGSVGTWYMLDEMLLFFKKLQQQIPEFKFLFITRDEHARIREHARALGIESSIIIQAADRYEIPALLSVCQFSVFFILPAYSKIASSPTKQGEIMAMGIPVICNSGVGDTDQIIRNYNSGYVIEDWKLDDCVDAIKNHTPEFSKDQIRDGACDYFSLESGVEKYARIYRRLNS